MPNINITVKETSTLGLWYSFLAICLYMEVQLLILFYFISPQNSTERNIAGTK